jgi:hypothetical protein
MLSSATLHKILGNRGSPGSGTIDENAFDNHFSGDATRRNYHLPEKNILNSKSR